MIRRVRIQGYKSLGDVEVSLRLLTVLLGPNAAGKSNFLDALQLLSRMATSRTLKEAFDAPYRGTPLESFAFGPGGIAEALTKASLTFGIEVDIELSNSTVERVERQIAEMRFGQDADKKKQKRSASIHHRLLRYRLGVEILPRSGVLRVVDENVWALRDDGEIKKSRNAFIERDGKRLLLRLEGQGHPTHHEIGLDHTLLSRPWYPPHYPHLAALRQELEGWSFFYFEPRERMRAANPVRQVQHIGLMGEELAAFLNTLHATERLQFKAVEKALTTLMPQIERIDVGPNSVGEVELKLVEQGVPIPVRLVSEGTLRMLGLLAVAGARQPSTLIAFEEPENGIHPRRIRLLAEFLKSRTQSGLTQFIATTHSPLLPDLLPRDSLFICRRSDRGTVIASFPNWSVGSLFDPVGIDEALEDDVPAVSDLILRGDLDE